MSSRTLLPLLLLAACTGGGHGAVAVASGLATGLVEAPGDQGEGRFDATNAVNGVRGGGDLQGSTDTFSLGYGEDDAHVVLDWGGAAVVDGEGFDLVVFENPFDVAYGGRFMDPTVVELSPDGERWVAFPHGYDGGPIDDPASWWGLAGLEPVFVHEEHHPVPYDADDAGGDRFDLADLDPSDPVAADVLADGAVAVRLSSAHVWTDPATGEPFPKEGISDGADIDGVAAR